MDQDLKDSLFLLILFAIIGVPFTLGILFGIIDFLIQPYSLVGAPGWIFFALLFVSIPVYFVIGLLLLYRLKEKKPVTDTKTIQPDNDVKKYIPNPYHESNKTPDVPEVYSSKADQQKRREHKTPSPLQKMLPDPFSEPTEILCTLIKKQGISVVKNSPAFNGLLKDYYKGEFKAELTILTKSVEENIPQDILAKKNKVPVSVLASQHAQRLEDCGFSKDLSIWAVDAWTNALEISK